MAAKLENLFIRACSTGRLQIVQRLINHGLSPNTRDKYGLTGLVWTARKGQVAVAEVLLTAGAALDAVDRRGRTALFHAVACKRYAFVEFLIAQGANLNLVDLHNWSPLDVATLPRNDRMIGILSRAGAQRKSTDAPVRREPGKRNSFSSGGALGGPDLPIEVERIHIQLNTLLHKWRGDYANVIGHFSFPLWVDGSLIRYTEKMNTQGAQPAKRKLKWLEVQIVVPESWWREPEPAYKERLSEGIEQGFHSMIALLRRNRHEVNANLLLADWETVKNEFLATPAPPFAAEKQRARMMSAVESALGTVKKRKKS